MKTRKIEIEVPDGKRAEWVNNVLTLVDDEPEDVMERVRTFKDALNELGPDHPLARQYNNIGDVDSDLLAYMKLRIVVSALNEGWTPKFTENEYRYYPWFILYTKDEYERLSQKEKDAAVLFGGSADNGALAGLVFAGSRSVPSNSSAHARIGSRLCLKSEALAMYCGKQFKELWFDYYIGHEFRR